MSGRAEELFDLLDGGGVVLGDGAMGTLLQTRGMDQGGAAELWNVDHADTIGAIHTEYAAAGARLVTTNTFGGTSARLALHGLEDRVHELNIAGARIAREVADRFDGWVLGDVGPSGELLAPIGLVEPDEIQGDVRRADRSARRGRRRRHPRRTDERSCRGRGRCGRRSRGGAGPAGCRHAHVRHARPHDDGREPGARRRGARVPLGARIVGGNCGRTLSTR